MNSPFKSKKFVVFIVYKKNSLFQKAFEINKLFNWKLNKINGILKLSFSYNIFH